MTSATTLLIVKDINISKDFYINLLGLELVEEHSDCLKLRIGSHPVILFQGDRDAVSYKHGFDANSTLVITVDDLDEKIVQLKAKGVVFIHDMPNQNRWGRYTAFRDPSGIIHELMAFH